MMIMYYQGKKWLFPLKNRHTQVIQVNAFIFLPFSLHSHCRPKRSNPSASGPAQTHSFHTEQNRLLTTNYLV